MPFPSPCRPSPTSLYPFDWQDVNQKPELFRTIFFLTKYYGHTTFASSLIRKTMKKHRISAFSMRNTCAVTYCLPTKPACDEKPSYILRGLQIPILGTSGLQIRWDGVFPKHYVYHKYSNNLYFYDVWVNNYFIRKINKANDFYRNLGF